MLKMMTNKSLTGVGINATKDVDLYTEDQLMMIESIPHGVHLVLGLAVSVIGCLGFAANATVLVIFSRFRRLRTPANIFIMNLAVADLGACCLHSLAAYSNFNGRWSFGRIGCQLYGLSVGLFGLISILTFSAIAVERCLVITSTPLGISGFKITRGRAQKICGFIWLYCGILVMLPFFGLSSYVPEGLLTTCSWDYTTRTIANRVYYIVLLTTGFLFPVVLICVSYCRIITSVIHHARQMVSITSGSGLPGSSSLSVLRKLHRQSEIRTANVVVLLILVYLTAWTPYAVVTCIGQFGPEGYLTPYLTAAPAYFAKTAVVIDPLVYGFSHPHFRVSFRHYLAGMRQPTGGIDNNLPNLHSMSYQSKNLTIYPKSASGLERNGGGSSSKERRMLRTFRNMSVDKRGDRDQAGLPIRQKGVSELCRSYVPVVSVCDPHFQEPN